MQDLGFSRYLRTTDAARPYALLKTAIVWVSCSLICAAAVNAASLTAVPRRVQATAHIEAARTLNVSASDQLQAVLNAAQPGDQIVIDAGARLTGNFALPSKATAPAQWITIRTSAPDDALPPPDHRITPDYAKVMAQLV